MPDGRPKRFPSTRLGKQPPYGPGQWLVAVAAAVGREGSKRSVVAAGVMVVQRRRWIGMVLMMGAEGPVGRR